MGAIDLNVGLDSGSAERSHCFVGDRGRKAAYEPEGAFTEIEDT